MVIDWQGLLAGLTIASGIFLAGRFLGKLESKVLAKESIEDECKQQLDEINRKLDSHIFGSAIDGRFEESDE